MEFSNKLNSLFTLIMSFWQGLKGIIIEQAWKSLADVMSLINIGNLT